MKFDSYITSGTKTAFTVDVNQKLIEYNKLNLKKAAFTLAETLITLTIIGVIAALTIPNLISSYQKHTYVVGLKKAYSQLQNAMKMIPITQGCPPGDYDCAGWPINTSRYIAMPQYSKPITNIENQNFNEDPSKKATYLLYKNFKATQLCYEFDNKKCKQEVNMYLDHVSMFISNDGMIWHGYLGDHIFVDINGYKGPNKWGRDRFMFYFSGEKGIITPYGSKLHADINGEGYYWRNNNSCSAQDTSIQNQYTQYYCTGRVLEEDAMNY